MMVLTLRSGGLQIALDACATSMGKIKSVHFVISDEAVYGAFKNAVQNLVPPKTQSTLLKPNPAPDPNLRRPDGGPSGPMDTAMEPNNVQAMKVDAGGEHDGTGKVFGASGESVPNSPASVAAKPKVTLVGGDARELRTWCQEEVLRSVAYGWCRLRCRSW